MRGLNLIMCLLFIIININLIFGFRPQFTSHGHQYEINYSKGGKHVITNINGEEEEIKNTDHSIDGHNTEFFTNEVEEYPHLLKSFGYNTSPDSGKVPSLADYALWDDGDTQYLHRPSLSENYNSINKKVDLPHKDPTAINLHLSNGENSNDELKFPFNFYDSFYDKQNFGSNQIVGLQDSSEIPSNLNGFNLKTPLPQHFKKLLAPSLFKTQQNDLNHFSLNSGNSNERKNYKAKVSKRSPYEISTPPTYIFEDYDDTKYKEYMKQLEINRQKEIQSNDLVNKSDPNLNKISKLVKPIIEKNCDDGRTNLEVDWDGSKIDYECNADVEIPTNDNPSTIYCDPSASIIQPKTRCMNETLEYTEFIPVIGDYRPVAPEFGEYKFIPKQRWLNSLDNGGVVLLYHPCAKRSEIDRLRMLIMKYYERYIFTPYHLDESAPFAVITRGCRLIMSRVIPNEVAHFLQAHGPQKIRLGKPNPRKIKYNLGLIEESRRHNLFGVIVY